jgi:probable F420-dependent oxidoreductase
MGYQSVWVSDHVVTPSHLLPSIGPIFYDAFVVLSHAAAFTQRVKLGSTVIVVPYRNPLVAAKMVATLDVLSGGRVIFGVGAGGAPDEFRALGVPSQRRGRLTDEYLRLMVALWTQDPTSFRGRFFSFEDVRFQPKPLQKPHPPIWVGGRSDAALRRAVAMGQAWHPTAMPLADLQGRIAALQLLARQAGRKDGPMVTIHQSIRLTTEDIQPEERRLGHGTPQQLREDVLHYQELGIPHVVCNFGAASVQELWEAMETFVLEVVTYFPEPV